MRNLWGNNVNECDIYRRKKLGLKNKRIKQRLKSTEATERNSVVPFQLIFAGQQKE